MAAKKTKTTPDRLLDLADRWKDFATFLVAIIAISSVPVGTYVFLIKEIGRVSAQVNDEAAKSQAAIKDLAARMELGFSTSQAETRVLIERLYTVDRDVQMMKGGKDESKRNAN